MYCETYRCTMSAAACAIRHRNAVAGGAGASSGKPGALDHNCRKCAVGAAAVVRLGDDKVAAYSKGMRTARANVMEYTAREGALELPAVPDPPLAPKPQPRPVAPESKPTVVAVVESAQPASGATKVCTLKNCAHGGNPQPVENFSRNKSRPDGLQLFCKECRAAMARRLRAEKTRICKHPHCIYGGDPQPAINFVTSARFCNDCREKKDKKVNNVAFNPAGQHQPGARAATDAVAAYDPAYKEVVALLVAEREFHLTRAAHIAAAIRALTAASQR